MSLPIKGLLIIALSLTCRQMRSHSTPVWQIRNTCLLPLKLLKQIFFRQGNTLTIARTSASLCAVTAMQNFFLAVQPLPGPLFSFQSGRLLTRSSVSALLRDAARHAGLPYKSLKGHSFRIGAASAAAAAGLLDWLIKVLGRWSSDCYQLYIRTPPSILLSAAPRMACSPGSASLG